MHALVKRRSIAPIERLAILSASRPGHVPQKAELKPRRRCARHVGSDEHILLLSSAGASNYLLSAKDDVMAASLPYTVVPDFVRR
jgi:hypothetical protein